MDMNIFVAILLGFFGAAIAVPVGIFLFLLTTFVLGVIVYGIFLLAVKIYCKFL